MKELQKTSILKKGKTMILAYDQGFEHGPVDFNAVNCDPQYIFDIALHGKYDALAVQAGLAHKYYHDEYQNIPLIVKLNGKSKFDNKDPVSKQHTTVEHAVELGAVAVGYTIYLGSSKEQEMFTEFGHICEQAHRYGLIAIAWMYPRGPSVKDEFSTDILSYATRIAVELGADIVKIKTNRDTEGMRWAIKNAGKSKVVIAGGDKTSDEDFLNLTKESLEAGAAGLAVGRNVWQHENPLKISRKIKKIIHGK